MRRSSERGSAIIMLFVAVALFGMLAFAFLQGSRTGTGWFENERAKANATGSQDCVNAVNLAMKRLEARGCGTLVSVAPDGSNSNPDAPTDGSCSVYHTNGGGVKFCTPIASPTDPCATGPIGTVCTTDGAIYIGTAGGNRIYTQATNASGGIEWKLANSATAGTTSTTNGKANTDAMIAAGAANHPAAQTCRAIGPQWYVPARDELALHYNNSTEGGASPGGPLVLSSINMPLQFYWSSTEYSSGIAGWHQRYNFGGFLTDTSKTNQLHLRCVRRDP